MEWTEVENVEVTTIENFTQNGIYAIDSDGNLWFKKYDYQWDYPRSDFITVAFPGR